MSSWLLITLSAYFLGALSAVIDKFLLVRPIRNPVVFTFFVGLLSIFVLILAPFGFAWPTWSHLLVDFGVGALYLFFAIAYYTAMKKEEVSRIAPLIGGLTPIFVFGLSFLFLGERLTPHQAVAFLFLVVGSVVISQKKGGDVKNWSIPLLAAFAGALYYVAAKFAFTGQPFLSAFIWTRIGTFVFTFLFLIPRKNREAIFESAKTIGKQTSGIFVFNKTLAGLSFVLINYAIALESPTLVNAMMGIQYLFVLILTAIIAKKHFEDLEEKFSWLAVWQKIIAIILIGTGLIFAAY